VVSPVGAPAGFGNIHYSTLRGFDAHVKPGPRFLAGRPMRNDVVQQSISLRLGPDAELGDEERAACHGEAFQEHRYVHLAHYRVGEGDHRGAMHDDRHRDQERGDEPSAQARAVVEEDQNGADEFDDGGYRHPEGAPWNRGRHQVDVLLHRGEVSYAREEKYQGEEDASSDADRRADDHQIVGFHNGQSGTSWALPKGCTINGALSDPRAAFIGWGCAGLSSSSARWARHRRVKVLSRRAMLAAIWANIVPKGGMLLVRPPDRTRQLAAVVRQ